jgi:type IV pilus assembly protein PilW
MIAMTLGLLVLTGVLIIFANTSTARAELQRASEQVDNGRYAFDVLAQDLQLAGYFAELDIRFLATPTTLPDLCSLVPADWASAIPFHLQGFDEGTTKPSCVPEVKPATDVVAIRRARTCVAGTSGCDDVVATLPYLQVNLCGAAGRQFVLGRANETAFPHKLKDCTSAAGQRRYVLNIYFIATDNGSGAAIPTLKRLEFNGNGYTTVPLVEGIEALQIEYGIDTDGDGGPDFYSADPSTFTFTGCASCTATSNWSNVVTAKIHVLSRSLDASLGYRNDKVYDLGIDAAGQPVRMGPFGDRFRRHMYSGTVRIMNPSARRDRP